MVRSFIIGFLIALSFEEAARCQTVYVIGPGSVGTYFSLALGQKNFVTIVSRSKKAPRQVWISDEPSNFFKIEGDSHLQSFSDWDNLGSIEPNSIVLISVKARDLQELGKRLPKWLDGSQTLVFLQNGIGIFDEAPELKGYRNKVRAMVLFGINLTTIAPAILKVGAPQKVILAGDQEAQLDLVESLFTNSGIKVLEKTKDVLKIEWKKTIHNIFMNGLTALCDQTIGQVLANKKTVEIATSLLNEAVRIAQSEGVSLSAEDIAHVWSLADGMKLHSTTMREDVRNGQRTENQWVYGHIVRVAETSGILAPTAHAIYDLISKRETGVDVSASLGFCINEN